MNLNPSEKKIMAELYYARRPLTTNEVAEKSGMSWQTAKKHLEQMRKRGLLSRGKKGSAIYWWIKM